MELSKSKLKQIIKEEIQRALAEKTKKPKKFDLKRCQGNCPGGHNKPECPEDFGDDKSAAANAKCRRMKRACENNCRKKATRLKSRKTQTRGHEHTPTGDEPLDV
jgi:hypothetical protein